MGRTGPIEADSGPTGPITGPALSERGCADVGRGYDLGDDRSIVQRGRPRAGIRLGLGRPQGRGFCSPSPPATLSRAHRSRDRIPMSGEGKKGSDGRRFRNGREIGAFSGNAGAVKRARACFSLITFAPSRFRCRG